MLELELGGTELYDEEASRFIEVPKCKLKMEHSLISISLWESKWKKPYLHSLRTLTDEESFDYVKCMVINKDVPKMIFHYIQEPEMRKIVEYINDPMTATWFSDERKGPPNRKVMTSEYIYYLMITNGIPLECQKWHINRLLTLIRVCENENGPQKKMTNTEKLKYYDAINEARKAKYHTRG